MGEKKPRPSVSEPAASEPVPFRLFANLGMLDYVTRGAGRDLVIVGRYGAREICITVPGSQVADLAAGLGRPVAKRESGQATPPGQLRLAFDD